MSDLGFGLAALGFWLFVGMAVLSGVWEDIRKREAQHETLRRMLESGQQVDHDTMDRLIGKANQADRDLRVVGLILRWLAPGLLAMGIMLAFVDGEAFFPLVGAAAIVGLLSVGMMAAAACVARMDREQAPDGAKGAGEDDTPDTAAPGP